MVDIPEGVNVRVEGHKVIAKGPAGEVQKTFSKESSVKVSGNKAEVTAKGKALANTVEAVLECMVLGAKSGYKKSMKLIYAHFPITIEVKGKDITVKNFLGEKQARKTFVVGSTKVEAKGQSVTISGPDKEAVGQTIANLRTAMRIKDKDPRVFQDGIYDAEGE
ncbi:MAG: 50S ribosomal protein L6 [Candidatus ainarchaeum sp.]|nr:50S ribosomal protein L6 [Candidatus ainarchaeum sp.]